MHLPLSTFAQELLNDVNLVHVQLAPNRWETLYGLMGAIVPLVERVREERA